MGETWQVPVAVLWFVAAGAALLIIFVLPLYRRVFRSVAAPELEVAGQELEPVESAALEADGASATPTLEGLFWKADPDEGVLKYNVVGIFQAGGTFRTDFLIALLCEIYAVRDGRSCTREVVIDMSRCTGLTDGAIPLLVAARQAANKAGFGFALAGTSEAIEERINAVGGEGFFETSPTAATKA